MNRKTFVTKLAAGSSPRRAYAGDPVGAGFVARLARPGGDLTGTSAAGQEVLGKQVELLSAAVPQLKRISVLMNSANPANGFFFDAMQVRAKKLLKEAFPAVVRVAVLIDSAEVVDSREVVQETQAGARRLGLQLEFLEVRGPNDFDAAFSLARQRRAQALLAIATNTMVTHRLRLATLAASDRLLSISEFPLMAQAGFLMAYGADLDELGRRSVTYLDKLLKGARPGDLPIERPAQFRLTINLKTAKALGITIAQALLLRADGVIQ